MKRYYLCPVIGSGSIADTYRAGVSGHGGNYVAVIPTGPDGRPLFPWALALVAAADHRPLTRDATLGPLPDVSLDIRMSALSQSAKAALDAALAKFGVDPAALVQNDGYREFVRSLGQALDAGFVETNFDVSD
jgi:hypothetical protein